MRTHLTILLAMLLCAGAASARDWYVSVDGTGDGLTSGSPTQDLAAVLNAAGSGDAIYLNGGDQFGYPANALTVAVAVTVQSFGTGQAILSNTTHVANGRLLTIAAGGSDSVIDNVYFAFMDYGSAASYATFYLLNNAHRITLKNSTFQHVDSPGGNWSGEPFIAMTGVAHTNLAIIGNTFLNLRYEAGLAYRHKIMHLNGASDSIVANNVASNYEGFIVTASPGSYRLQIVSNTLYQCMAALQFGGTSTAGGILQRDYDGISSGSEVAWNIIYNGPPYASNVFQTCAFYIPRDDGSGAGSGFNNVKFHHNTLYEIASVFMWTSTHGSGTGIEVYDNIFVRSYPGGASTGFWSNVGGISSGTVYSNLWDPFQEFTNENYDVAGVDIAGNPVADPQFASLDPSHPLFLRPQNLLAKLGYSGTDVGAKVFFPEPASVMAL
ncbi:hypothetical protein GX586_09805, partial [bacterium]|nr:hypothetical protein [bacterium]